MPKLNVRNAVDVPAPTKSSKAIQEQQKLYEGFIPQATAGQVGVLTLEPDEAVRSVKVRLRRAATRLGTDLEIWDIAGTIYFQASAPKARRGRPHKKS